MKSAFISHSWNDKALARRIAAAIDRLGGRVWLDEAEIQLGDSLIRKISQGIDEMDFVVAIISEHSVASEWVTRELDLAMNHEIEGKSVKVLPILASRCQLPGFLQGKLYADMSTPQAYKKALPQLLQRLGASPTEAIAQISKRDRSPRAQEAWLVNLRRALATDEPGMQHQALREVPNYPGYLKPLLSDQDTVERLTALANSSTETSVLREAIRVIGATSDPELAYHIEPLADHPSFSIVATVAEALARMQSEDSARTVLSILLGTTNVIAQLSCLKYFSDVALRGDSDVLALVGATLKLLEPSNSNPGVELAIARAVGMQFELAPEMVVPTILRLLESPHDQVRLGMLVKIMFTDDPWFSGPHTRLELAKGLVGAMHDPNPQVAAASWLVGLNLSKHRPESFSRDLVWTQIALADPVALEAWFEYIDQHNAETVFSEPGDEERLRSLFRDDQRRNDLALARILLTVGEPESLCFLASKDLLLEGWDNVRVLRAVVPLDQWVPELGELLDSAISGLPEYAGTEGAALALLAQFVAGRLDASSVAANLPSEFAGFYMGAEDDRLLINLRLRDVAEAVSGVERRRVRTIIRTLNEELLT